TDYGQSKIIRDLILSFFEKNNINVPWKNRFVLVSDELINNSIEYGSLPLDKNLFLIRFGTEGNTLSINIEVSDTGRGLESKTSQEMEELKKLKEMDGSGVYLGKRGRGLFQLVTNLVDELYFRDHPTGGLVVGIRKKLELL
ncbi:MAG: ATP-binding protein, partial [Candidatus Gracilibacteria bacterium]|nr:ATP-binding protein [Candidatus Gracilibacteria bacterium]